MNSPTITQFTEAVQNPNLSLQIPQLANPIISRNQRGQPLVWAGNFAAVYQLQSNQSAWALRGFTTPPNGKQLHYRLLDNALQNRNIPCLSPFLFHQVGILVSVRKFPVITMEWINGLRLDAKVPQLLNHPHQLRTLATSILDAAHTLEANTLAHNDLQHANIIVQDDVDIKLVDYDAFYLPEYQGRPTPEAGHPNYQHPRKSSTTSAPAPTASLPSSSSSASKPSPPTRPSGSSITRTTSSSPARISCHPKPPPPSTKQPEARTPTSGTSPTPSPAFWPKAPTTPRPSTSSQQPNLVTPNRANPPPATRAGSPNSKPLIIRAGASCLKPANPVPKPNPTPLTHIARIAATTPLPAGNPQPHTARIAAVTSPQPAKTLNQPHIARIPHTPHQPAVAPHTPKAHPTSPSSQSSLSPSSLLIVIAPRRRRRPSLPPRIPIPPAYRPP